MSNSPKRYIRCSFTLPPDLLARIQEAAKRRREGGLDKGSSSGIVRIATERFLDEWDKSQLKGEK